MKNTDIFNKFIYNNKFDNDNIDKICDELNINEKQLIRKSFKCLFSLIGDIPVYIGNKNFMNKMNNCVSLINVLCSKEDFTDEEILINRLRLKKSRESLLAYYNKYHEEKLLTSANLLDEIVLDKNIKVDDLKLLLKELVDRKEDINVIKRFLNNNKGVIIINNNSLFDYVFNKAIECILNNSADIYYYVALLKIFYSTKINKDKYLRILNEYTTEENEFANEIYMIIHGNRRSLKPNQILSKYGMMTTIKSVEIPKLNSRSNIDETITIDDYSTGLRDDAISIKKDGNNYIIGVHIANPGKFINQNSIVDIQARNNYKCLYIKDAPRLFSTTTENELSLNKNKVRSTISMYIVIDNDGNILDYYLKDNVIKIVDNLYYKQANQLIDLKSENELSKLLNELYNISICIGNKNLSKVEYWNKKDIGKNINAQDNKSERIIEELTVLYNNLLATLACENNIPFVYRTQNDSYLRKLINKYEIELDNSTLKSINSIYLPSKYSSIPLYHYGLHIAKYAHCADPLRRYPDFYNQLLIHKFYFNDIDFEFDYDEYLNLIDYFNQRSVELSLMKSEYIRALKLTKKD